MRLFVAIEIPEDVRQNLARVLREFRAMSPEAKWVRPENMHLTLKFLGEIDAAKLNDVQAILAAIRSPHSVALEFRGVGFFPNVKRPRVFWAGVESSANLSMIAAQIDHALHTLSFPLEDRPFTPHLTLARFSQPSLAIALQTAASVDPPCWFGSFSASQFHLIESRLKSAGAEYTTLESYSFVSEA